MPIRFALDIGTQSIGWAVLELDRQNPEFAVSLLDMGVRVYHDGREPAQGGRIGDSLAVERRMARGMRRSRDRKINRKKALVRLLQQHGLLPKEAERFDQLVKLKAKDASQHAVPTQQPKVVLHPRDPYVLRARAVREAVTPHELGRVLLHLAQRRGFKSNRKTDNDSESAWKARMTHLQTRLDAAGQTLGEYLLEQRIQGKPARFYVEGEDFPTRKMLEEEWQRILQMQKPHQTLSEAAWQEVTAHLLFQHPLRPVERGWCTYLYAQGERRAYADLPISHAFRIEQELNNLRYTDGSHPMRPLTAEQKDRLRDELYQKKTMQFTAMGKLKYANKQRVFPQDVQFNLTSDKRKGLDGHKIIAIFSADDVLGAQWNALSATQQNDLLEALYAAEEDAALMAELQQRFGFSEEQARACSKQKLKQDTVRLSRRFMEEALPLLRDEQKEDGGWLTPQEVAAKLGYVALSAETGERMDQLPYYGEILPESCVGGDRKKAQERLEAAKAKGEELPHFKELYYGKIPNPTIHLTLNQLRRVVNSLIARYGNPDSIHLETTRDLKNSREKRDEITRKQAREQKENERIRQEFVKHGIAHPSRMDIRKYKMWEALGKEATTRRCIYSGDVINDTMFFNGEAEIEHILPRSKTLDDSQANLTFTLRSANRAKGNKPPYEAFAHHPGYDYDAIVERMKKVIPQAQWWRFLPGAMEEFERRGDFAARQLNDTAYVSRLAKRYLTPIHAGASDVVAIPGKLTAAMRKQWGLNHLLKEDGEKDREEHRHHALDALVVGLTTRSVLKAASDATAKAEEQGTGGWVRIPEPKYMDRLRHQAAEKLHAMVISHKPDHGHSGKFFQETAYGIIPEDRRDPELPNHTLVTRKAFTGLKETELGCIRNIELREDVREWMYEHQGSNHDLPTLLARFCQQHPKWKGKNIKRVRILVQNQSAVPIASAPHKAYAPDSFCCVDIYRLPKGKAGKWKAGEYDYQGAFRSYIDMHAMEADQQASDSPARNLNQWKPHPAARHLMRLYKNDMIQVMEDGKPVVMRVGGFSTTDNKMDVRPQLQAKGKQNFKSINVLIKQGMIKLKVAPDGRILNLKKHAA